jgi:hypothetical protein
MEHSNFFKVVIIAGFFILSSPAGADLQSVPATSQPQF